MRRGDHMPLDFPLDALHEFLGRLVCRVINQLRRAIHDQFLWVHEIHEVSDTAAERGAGSGECRIRPLTRLPIPREFQNGRKI